LCLDPAFIVRPYVSSSAGTTLTVRRAPREKTTRPVSLANMVSSPPMPAPGPGANLVPRCLTMMDPAGTI